LWARGEFRRVDVVDRFEVDVLDCCVIVVGWMVDGVGDGELEWCFDFDFEERFCFLDFRSKRPIFVALLFLEFDFGFGSSFGITGMDGSWAVKRWCLAFFPPFFLAVSWR